VELHCGDINWIQPPQYKVRWLNVLNVVTNVHLHKERKKERKKERGKDFFHQLSNCQLYKKDLKLLKVTEDGQTQDAKFFYLKCTMDNGYD
jgi:hypothetical protein